MSFVQLISTTRNNLIYLIQAEEAHQKRKAWYYVQVEKLKLPILSVKIKTNVNLLEFGKILFSGWGENPPEDIKQRILEEYS